MYTSQLGSSLSQLGKFQLGGVASGGLDQTITDTLVFTELMYGVTGLFTDTLTFIDTLTNDVVFDRTFSDTLTFLDYLPQPLDDTLTFSDDMEGLVWKVGNFADTLSLTEDLLLELISSRSLAETLVLNDQFSYTLRRLLSFSDTVGFTDALNGVAAHLFGDTVTFSDAMTEFVAKVFKDILDFADTLSLNGTYHRSLSDQLVLFENFSYHAVLRKALSDTLVFADSMIGLNVKYMNDTVVFNDVATGVRSTPIKDTLTFTDAATYNKSIGIDFDDNVFFADNVDSAMILVRSISDVLDFTELIRCIPQKFGNFSDTLTFVDHQYREVHTAPIVDTLVFSESLTYHKDSTRTLSETLVLTDTLGLKIVANRGWSDYLLFREGFTVKVRSLTAPNPGVRPVANPAFPTLPGGAPPLHLPPEGYLPSPVWEGVIRVLPQVVMVGHTRTIVLPPPEFNDFVAGQGKIAVQRSMTGRFRVYAKRTSREKVSWRFVIPKNKADEFRNFILAEVDNEITVVDWEGNYWNFKILSDTVDFTETRRWSPSGNAVEVSIEFVGNRYA